MEKLPEWKDPDKIVDTSNSGELTRQAEIEPNADAVIQCPNCKTLILMKRWNENNRECRECQFGSKKTHYKGGLQWKVMRMMNPVLDDNGIVTFTQEERQKHDINLLSSVRTPAVVNNDDGMDADKRKADDISLLGLEVADVVDKNDGAPTRGGIGSGKTKNKRNKNKRSKNKRSKQKRTKNKRSKQKRTKNKRSKKTRRRK
jgi:hypothetical protein